MDKLTQYTQWIQLVLEKHGRARPANGDIKVYTFFDHENHHYQVYHAGWNRFQRIFGPLIHIDLIEDISAMQY